MKADADPLYRAMLNDGIITERHALAVSTWDAAEVEAACAVLRGGRMTMGDVTSEYERQFAAYVGTRYAVACNSGSSANLLMVAAWTLRYGRGTVIVPALGWATCYAPFQQHGWRLRFVDCDRETLNFDLAALWRANEHDDADLVLAVNVLGNPNEFGGFPRRVRVLEDNCEALGAEYGNRRTGSFGEMASHSTYFAHHISTMEGGVVTTSDRHFYHMLLALRSHGWTRHLPADNIFGVAPGVFDFVLPGYNVRPTEVSSAIGLAQLAKLPRLVAQRRDNARRFPLKTQREIGASSWYGFAVFDDDVAIARRTCETRPVISGNFLRSPSLKHYDYEVCGATPNADYIHDHAVMIGNRGSPVDWSFLRPRAAPVVPVAVGELLDKISILQIKARRIADPAAGSNVARELSRLLPLATGLDATPGMAALRADLQRVNERLWEVEAAIRDHERRGAFDGEFVELARTVYLQNDERGRIKREINRVSGSELIEEKSWL